MKSTPKSSLFRWRLFVWFFWLTCLLLGSFSITILFQTIYSFYSVSTTSLPVRRTRLSTVGDRAFPVAAASTWNDLPRHVTSASSLRVFRSRLLDAPLPAFFFVTVVQCRRSDSCHYWHFNSSFYLLTYSYSYIAASDTVTVRHILHHAFKFNTNFLVLLLHWNLMAKKSSLIDHQVSDRYVTTV